MCAATGLSVRNLSALNRDHFGAIDKYTEFPANSSIILASDPESDGEDVGGSDEDLAHGAAAAKRGASSASAVVLAGVHHLGRVGHRPL